MQRSASMRRCVSHDGTLRRYNNWKMNCFGRKKGVKNDYIRLVFSRSKKIVYGSTEPFRIPAYTVKLGSQLVISKLTDSPALSSTLIGSIVK